MLEFIISAAKIMSWDMIFDTLKENIEAYKNIPIYEANNKEEARRKVMSYCMLAAAKEGTNGQTLTESVNQLEMIRSARDFLSKNTNMDKGLSKE